MTWGDPVGLGPSNYDIYGQVVTLLPLDPETTCALNAQCERTTRSLRILILDRLAELRARILDQDRRCKD